jgi:hypothetical protein
MTPVSLIAAAAALTPFFPAIANWLSAPNTEPLAKQILDIAQTVTGQVSPPGQRAALQQDPQLVLSFQKMLFELEKSLAETEAQDRNQARMRDLSLLNAGRQNFRADIMVMAAAFGLTACLLALAFYRGNLPGEAVGIISTIAGIFGSCLKDAYAFEFGSSRGSKDKDTRALLTGFK